ncbi:SCG1 protein, partial [Upupa epops]|nr:SCG1 protein [Upupa epops]
LPGVSAVPVEKDHLEEMVTQCIVEVLSNALSKPSAPPINPECKEILKKSSRNDRERSEDKQLEVRRLTDLAAAEKHYTGSVVKEQSQGEVESKTHMKGNDEEKLAHEEDKGKEEEDGQHPPVPEERFHTEKKKHYLEMRRDEEKSSHRGEESRESEHHDREVEHATLDKKSPSGGLSSEFSDGKGRRPMGHWHSEEGMQNLNKRIQEGEEREAEEERSEKYHHESKERDFSLEQESDETEETDEEKQPYKAKRYHGKHRMGDSSEEKRRYGGEKEEVTEELSAGDAHLWDKRNHHQKHHEETEQQHEDESGSQDRHRPEEVEEKRTEQGSEQYRESLQQSKESSEENRRHEHSKENREKWQEERRPHDGSHEARRHHSEGRTYLGDESEEELDTYLGGGSREKQHGAGGGSRLWERGDEGSETAFAQEHKGQARKHYSTEDSGEQQHYPGNSEEEEVQKKDQSRDQMKNEKDNIEEGRYAEREEYRSHLPAETEKRTVAPYSSLYPLLWWKSQHFEKRDSAGEQLLEGKEGGRRPNLKEKSPFPEYSDYDWWDKKPILSALNHGQNEKRNHFAKNMYDINRQYNRMEQLAQLLNYRKKSAELPELYNSGEGMKNRHVIRSDRRGLSQRPLAEGEEKELANLAAMDLEMQKIAKKFNDNRRG